MGANDLHPFPPCASFAVSLVRQPRFSLAFAFFFKAKDLCDLKRNQSTLFFFLNEIINTCQMSYLVITLPGIMTFMLREKTLPGVGNINQKISFWPVHCWLGDPGFLGQEGSCVDTSQLPGRCPEHLAFRPCLARVTLEAVTVPVGTSVLLWRLLSQVVSPN